MPSPGERKLLILEAATPLLARQGYDATTLAQIAQASGASIGSIVNFFLDKPHLALRVRESALAHLAAAIGTALHRHHRSVAKAAKEVIGAYVDWVRSNPDMAILVLEQAISPTERGGGLTVAACLVPVFEAWAADFRESRRLSGYEARYLVAVILGPAMTFVPAQGEQHWQDCRQDSLVADLTKVAAAALRAGSKSCQSPTRPNHECVATAEHLVPPQPAQLRLL